MVLRLVTKDLRINAGAAIVLASCGDAAAAAYKKAPAQLRNIVLTHLGSGAGGPSARHAAAAAAAGGGRGKGVAGQAVGLMEPCEPQLASQLSSFDGALKKYGSGYFVEIKWDGERCQAHMRRGSGVRPTFHEAP